MSAWPSPTIAAPSRESVACEKLRARPLTRIALVGPDGVGKSTVIALLREWFAEALPQHRVEVRRWRPGLLPDLGWFLGKPAVHVKSVKPRRQGGRLHALRILYYYWDFLIGAWWKDQLSTPRGSLVIYDRCALDMQVDPARFGLRSARGAGLLSAFTPKPDVVILLSDTPERICSRKQELEPAEVSEQLGRWRELAKAGQVHATIRVDAEPAEITARVRQLIVDAMFARREASADAPEQPLDWIGRIVCGRPEGQRKFAILPSQRNPRFLVPLESRAIAARSLAVLNPQRMTGRAWRSLITLGLRLGVAQGMLPTALLRSHDLERFVSKAIGGAPVRFSISLGRGSVHRKPVLQVMRMDGAIAAYAKVGWNTSTIALVQNERQALRLLESESFSTAVLPRVLHSGWFNGNCVLVQSAAGDAPTLSRLDDRHLRFLVELARLAPSQRELPWSEPTAATRARIGKVSELGFAYYAHLLERAIEFCAAESPLAPCGFSHGDFAPWNIRAAGQQLAVLDWELAGSAPLGWDLFHFLIGSGIELERKPGAELYRDLRGPSETRQRMVEYFAAVNVAECRIETLLAAWLAEKLSRNLVVFEHAPTAEDAMSRRAWATMLDLLVNQGESVA